MFFPKHVEAGMSMKMWLLQLRLGNGPERNHRTGMNRYRTGTGWVDRNVDRYRDEPDRNYRYGYTVPSRSTIYRDGTGTDRNGPNGTDDKRTTHLAILKMIKKFSYFNF
ncbi:hypothetical protein H5410_059314 [Solanum commersonii]|uniref:Uncharacterized protein n=1 Tax=Solanum commersonii TaxID=4109 RepID=A0A9J5W2K3_SOLCO|nr:hypothetical protein H5410_059314 [Solanum commersonii]